MGPDLHHGLCAGLGQLLKGAAAGQRQPLRDCVRQDALALADRGCHSHAGAARRVASTFLGVAMGRAG